MRERIIQVAIAGPFLRGLHYLILSQEALIGCRVRVPLGRRKVIGVVLSYCDASDISYDKLKTVYEVVDSKPLFSAKLLKLFVWISRYYHCPIGEVFATAMPSLLNSGKVFLPALIKCWFITDAGLSAIQLLKRAPRQLACLQLLADEKNGLNDDVIKKSNITSAILKNLEAKGFIRSEDEATKLKKITACKVSSHFQFNADQQLAFSACSKKIDEFAIMLLDGVTGSGKTEVYLQLIDKVLQKGKQVLVLVPEIGLTPQTLQRFVSRFSAPVVTYHSKLTDKEKLAHWYWAAKGDARIIIGTRSAVFMPCDNLGLIVIDEEHDLSFKQQTGLRYLARDVAIMRAKITNIPIVLGSATPSLESLNNALLGKYQHLKLHARAGVAKKPNYHLIDIRQHKLQAGLSKPLLDAMRRHLHNNGQVLIFINRRGYAPVLMCHNCGWSLKCQRCDMHYTFHNQNNKMYLSCHHCGVSKKIPNHCCGCGQSEGLIDVGFGTEKIEKELNKLFADYLVVRMDRDSTARKGEFGRALDKIHSGEAKILVGTQMLAKGHHFKNLSMVGIVNLDAGLFSSDFRAMEKTGQLIDQVAGRSGRELKQGEVFLQTHNPEHPALLTLLEQGYAAFATELLYERQSAGWPPYSYLTILRAQGIKYEVVAEFLTRAKEFILKLANNSVQVLGPVSAILGKKAGKFRMQLLLQATNRQELHRVLNSLVDYLYGINERKIRWQLDVDPQEM